MRLSPYPQCCRAQVLHDFGAGHFSEHGDGFKGHRASAAEIKRFLDNSIVNLQKSYIQVLFACPTNHQPEAIEALTEYGFFGAPEEDLKAVEQTYKKSVYNAITGLYEYMEEEIPHQMYPMFFLIPPLKTDPQQG